MLYTIFTIDFSGFHDVDFIKIDGIEISINNGSPISFITEYKNEYNFQLYPHHSKAYVSKYDITVKLDGYKKEIDMKLEKNLYDYNF